MYADTEIVGLQSGELNRLSFYFDSDTKSWPMEKPWEELLPKEWSKVLDLYLILIVLCIGRII